MTRPSPTSTGLPSERPSWWSRFLSLGTYPGMPFDLRREVYLLNGSTWVLLFVTTLLLLVWLFLRRGAGIWMGLVIEVFGVFLLWLISRRQYQTAVVMLCAVMSCAVVYQSYFFQTGSHIYLLTIVAIAAFLVRSSLWRRSLSLALVGVFVGIQAIQMGERPSSAVLPVRYLGNMAVAGICLYGICSLFREISDEYRRRLDQRNRELQEANAAREKIFSILSHDLRGPVAALKQGLDLLDEGTITSAEFDGMRADLKQGVDSVFSSMENLLEWAAGQMHALRHAPVRVDLRDALADDILLLERTAAVKGIAIENRLPEGAAAFADLHQIHAVFRNLVSNALKFTSRGGLVEVSGAPESPGWWRLSVRDTGVGMSPEQAASLFDGKTFESTRGTADEKGLGLGLQICRDFVRVHGGEISVESAPGKGTVFSFTLPAWREKEAFSIPKDGLN